ncbi:hypothetical protein EGQ24_03695 [bacterium]|nr:hypothetical protein [bacterium]
MNIKISTNNFNIPKINFKSDDNKKNMTAPKESKLEKTPQNDTFEMSVGYVNDEHGQTNNMMRILSGLKGDLRVSAGDNDIGDEKNKAVHRATMKFMNLANITATALGNHELDTTQSDLLDSIEDYDGDILATNMNQEDVEAEDPKDVEELGRAPLAKSLKNSKVVEVKGEKIGLVGASPIDMFDRLTHPNYHTDCSIDALEDTIEDIQDEVDRMKEQGINKIFLLSHLGHQKDQIVAQNTKDIDVIIGGHTHELVKDIKEGENLFYNEDGEPVVLTEAGRDGAYFGKLNLTFDKNGVITRAQNNLGETRLFHKNMINQYIFDEILGKPEKVGFIRQAPPPPTTLIEENPHANFVCDAMKEEMGADIGVWNNSGIRNFFHEGVIDSRDIKDIAPFFDRMSLAEVSEKTLVDMFKATVKTTYTSHGNKPGLLAVSGLNYTVSPKKGELTAMNFVDKNGNEIPIDINNPSADKMYKVATDEFMMSAGADYAVLAPHDKCIEIRPYDKDVITCEYIKHLDRPIDINQTGRIKFED